ncbi:HD domain-containing protein [Pseudodesulfovibrio cashew]|nr:HD domain-containing protein [Pseudodesulfovibrio cashew]
MTQSPLHPYEQWFHGHVDRYLALAGEDAFMVERKVRHTRRVLAHARAILKEIKPGATFSHVVEVATLLHDVGRFPQLVDQGTYDDRAGFNHAEAGAEILESQGVLAPLDEVDRRRVLDLVRYHNRAVVPEGLDPDTRLGLHVVRNADKLDAIRNNLKYLNPAAPHGKALKAGVVWHDAEVSPAVLERARNRQLIPFADIRWSNDFILFLCCWLYDLHFRYSFRHLLSSGRFEELLGRLPDHGPLAELADMFREDLERLAEEGADPLS